MLHTYFRKGVSYALPKAALIVMLSLAAWPATAQEPAPAAAEAQTAPAAADTEPPDTTAAETQIPVAETPATPAADTPAADAVKPPENAAAAAAPVPETNDSTIEEGGTIVVQPQGEEGIDSLEERYPFLKAMLADVRLYNEEFKDNPTKVMTSTVRDPAQNIELFFASVQGPMTCSDNQCQMNIFINAGDGYKQVTAGPAPLPVHVLKDDGVVSLYFCTPEDGRAQWVLKDGSLTFVGNVIAPQSGPACAPASPATHGPKN